MGTNDGGWWRWRAACSGGLVLWVLGGCAGSTDTIVGGRTVPDAGTMDGSEADDGAMDATPPPPEEPCNGRDDDGDGQVDEGCACTPGTSQSCYPMLYPPEGCMEGTQQCSAAGTWGACEGYQTPGDGRSKCCLALDGSDEPIFEQLDKCMTAWPSDTIPGCRGVAGWMPMHPDCTFTHASASTGHEYVDRDAGGIHMANVEAGRMAARNNALMDFGIAADDIVYERTPDIVVVGEEGCWPGGRAHAWGSFLYKKADGSVGEVVYLYVGNCESGCDDEAFLRLSEPVQACAPGTILE